MPPHTQPVLSPLLRPRLLLADAMAQRPTRSRRILAGVGALRLLVHLGLIMSQAGSFAPPAVVRSKILATLLSAGLGNL